LPPTGPDGTEVISGCKEPRIIYAVAGKSTANYPGNGDDPLEDANRLHLFNVAIRIYAVLRVEESLAS